MPSEAKPAENYVEKPKTLAELRAGIISGRAKATDLAASYYERIERKNPRLNVYLCLTKERALEQAERVDDAAAKGDPLGVLAGIPVGIKDVLVMKGAPATAGSKILQGYHPPYDATAVSRLEAAGAVLLGKLNCDEFAMGSSNENSAYGPVRNPVDTERVPGGSSRRIGGGRGGQPGRGHAGLRYRRLHSPAGQLLRRGGRAAHLWPRLALRADRLCLLAGPRGAVCGQRARRRHNAGRDRRPRFPRRNQLAGSGARLCCRER